MVGELKFFLGLQAHQSPRGIFISQSQYAIELLKKHGMDECVSMSTPMATERLYKKNPHAKIFYINKQQAPEKPKEEIYSNSKIVQIIKTYWELGHEHKFIIEIVARKANGSVVSITESYYKNLNKNDIEDMYLLIINHNVDDYAKTGLL
nr:uncharacterized mitochondrial protein AtMg00810-like [Tanacetum cinerariifolium]